MIDPVLVLDYDYRAMARVSIRSVGTILEAPRADGLIIDWMLDNHPPTRLSVTSPLRSPSRPRSAARVWIGEHIKNVQKIFRSLFNAEDLRAADGNDFDHLLKDGGRFMIGSFMV